jgi:hypothetical protein
MDTPTNINALYTIQTLVSLQGAAGLCVIVPNILTYLLGPTFKDYAKWVSFGLALFLALLGAAVANDPSWIKWVVALFNGFLIFGSAIGYNEMAARALRGGRAGRTTEGRPPFFHSWFN